MRVFSFVVTAVAIIACIMTNIVCADDEELSEIKEEIGRDASGAFGGFEWDLVGDTLTISGSGKMDNFSQLGYVPWYHYKNSISTVKFEGEVTTIGTQAFSECGSLVNVEIPSSVTSIGDDAFSYCSSLKSIVIPERVKAIGNYAFGDCNSLSEVNIQSNVLESMGYSTFLGCPIEQIFLPSSLKSIGSQAFYECIHLKEVSIPSNVESIGSDAFSYCSDLRSIKVDSNNMHFSDENGVLFNKYQTVLLRYPPGKSGSSYSIPDSVETIDRLAFEGTYLTSVTIDSSVTSIGNQAFSYSDITSVFIPANVKTIGSEAFFPCEDLTRIDVDGANENYSSLDGVLFDSECTTLIQYPLMKNTKYYVIPASVTTIKANAFSGNDILEDLIIPESVTSIDSSAFSYCYILKSVRVLTTKGISCSQPFSGSSDITSFCAPPDYSPAKFCGVSVTPNTETCQSFRSLFNQCYTATIQDGVLRQVKRQNATEWESRSKGCLHYECDNDIGGWINKTCARGQACYVGKCGEVDGDCSYIKVEGYDELEKQVNQCYEIECDESKNEWELVKRANASAWENKSNGCKRYECNNESGGISTPLKTCSEGPACYNRNGKCNESDGECVYEKVEGYEEVEKGVNECYEVMCDEGNNEWVLRKRANASEWESRSDSDGCYEYHCDNESGFVRWSKCNNSVGVTRRCVNGECVEEKSTSSEEEEKGWTVEIDFGEMDVSELNESEVKEQISSLTGIDADELKVVVEIDRDGNKVRVIVYVKDEESANNIASKLNNIDKGGECPYGVLCRARTVRVVEVQVISCGYKSRGSMMVVLAMANIIAFAMLI